MARALTIEDECGTCGGFMHPHNGYYAGDFGRHIISPGQVLIASPRLGTGTPVDSTRPVQRRAPLAA